MEYISLTCKESSPPKTILGKVATFSHTYPPQIGTLALISIGSPYYILLHGVNIYIYLLFCAIFFLLDSFI